MKKLLTLCAFVLGSALGMEASAQQTQAVNGNKQYNIYYALDIPYTAIPEQDKKMEDLDKQFKAFEAAMNKGDNKKAAALKVEIQKWLPENKVWIDQLESYQSPQIYTWIEMATKSLRLNDEIK